MKLTATLEVLMRDLPKILAAGVEVDEVEVSGKAADGNHHIGWFWSQGERLSSGLPRAISDRLKGGKPIGEQSYKFRTADEARKALSDAVIVWATQQNQ